MDIALAVDGRTLTWPLWQSLVRAAEELGFAGLFRSGDGLDLWTSLVWQADHTTRLALGPLVTWPALQHPVHMARQAAQVDDLSGGRLVLGLGVGPGTLAMFDETLEVVWRLLRTPEATFSGQHYRLKQAKLLPTPHGPPILVAGRSPDRTLPLAAVFADEWNARAVSPDQFKALSARLDTLLDAAKRPRESIRRSVLVDRLDDPSVWEKAGAHRVMVSCPTVEAMETLAKVAGREKAARIQPSGIRRVADAPRTRPDVISLALGEPDFDTPAPIKAAACQAIQEGFNSYTPSQGLPEVREAVGRKLWRDLGVHYDPGSEIMMTAGAINALSLALHAALRPGDHVLITDPGYAVFEPCVTMADGVPVRVPLRAEHGFRLQADDIRQALTPRTRAIIINSPNNPTGSVLGPADLEALANVAQEHDLLVLSDEVYEKFIYTGLPHLSIASWPGMKGRTVVLNSFSKTCCICGWRIGFAAAPAGLIYRMVMVQQMQVVSVSSVAQRALASTLDETPWIPGMVAEFERRGKVLAERLNTIPGFSCAMPHGAFYLFVQVPGSSEAVAKRLADDAGVLTVPGRAFGPRGEGYLRVSFARPLSVLEEAAARIRQKFTE
ncbi:MAG TPA: aminotransferase class I/II-fold pyridoxal phosphate-dependent enzyme [Candidatus Xenobia bacterium]